MEATTRWRAMKALLVALAVGTAGTLLSAQVPYDRILRAAAEPHNWLTYHGGYLGQR